MPAVPAGSLGLGAPRAGGCRGGPGRGDELVTAAGSCLRLGFILMMLIGLGEEVPRVRNMDTHEGAQRLPAGEEGVATAQPLDGLGHRTSVVSLGVCVGGVASLQLKRANSCLLSSAQPVAPSASRGVLCLRCSLSSALVVCESPLAVSKVVLARVSAPERNLCDKAL